jgi:hypothetical protein
MDSFDKKISKDPLLKKLKGMEPSNVKKMETFNEGNWILDDTVSSADDVIPVRRKGKFEQWQVPIEMAQAIKNMSPKELSAFIRYTIGSVSNIFRFGTVAGNIGFALPNVFRDQITAANNTKNIPIMDWFSGAKSFLRQDEVYKMHKRMGGGMASPESGISGGRKSYADFIYGGTGAQFLDPFYWNDRGILKGTKDLSYWGISYPFKKTIGYAINISEAGTRLGVFKRELKSQKIDFNNLKAKDAEFAIRQAVHASRHSTGDFNRYGYSTRNLNKVVVPFFNMALEGPDRYVRSWVDPISKGKVPVRQIMYVASTFIFYAAQTAWNRFADEEEYKKISQREKENNWIFMKGEGEGTDSYFKIPKAHDTKFILNGPQMIFEKMEGLANPSWTDIATSVFLDVSPIDQGNIIPVPLKLIIEPFAGPLGYDFYWRSTIENPSQRTWSPGYRFKAGTSETLKTIGKALNISPPMMQHEVRSLFGGLGTDILWLTDWALGATGVQPPPNISPEKTPIIKRFYGKAEEWKSDTSQRLYKINKRLREIERGGKTARINKMRKAGAPAQVIKEALIASKKEKRKLLAKKRDLLAAKTKLSDMISQLIERWGFL